jgi:hypothetical protein
MKILWELTQNLKDELDHRMPEHIHMRNMSVVSEEWVSQKHPEIV